MDVKLPPLGEGADSGTVVSLLVKEGDEIKKGQSLLEIETGKAVAPVPSTAAGKISKIHVREGAKIAVGQLIVSLAGDEALAAGAPKAPAPKTCGHKSRPSKPAPAKPAEVEETSTEESAAENEAESKEEDYEYDGAFPPPASPALRRVARQLGIDLRKVPGSENGGRIVLSDLKAYIRRLKQLAAEPKGRGTQPPAVAAPADFSRWGQIAKRPMSPLRKIISQRMAENWNAIPHVTQFDEADLTRVMEFRKARGAEIEKQGARLTVTPFVIQAVAAALKKFPMFNSSLDPAADEIIYKEYYNIGLAVDTDQGLIVPVIKNADKKSLLELAREVEALAVKTRERKVSMEELAGGTFTISNQGGIGGGHFTPIVNKPEVAILGVGRGAFKPVVRDQAVQVRLLLPLCLSYDHRVVDGGDAVRFMMELVRSIENLPAAGALV